MFSVFSREKPRPMTHNPPNRQCPPTSTSAPIARTSGKRSRRSRSLRSRSAQSVEKPPPSARSLGEVSSSREAAGTRTSTLHRPRRAAATRPRRASPRRRARRPHRPHLARATAAGPVVGRVALARRAAPARVARRAAPARVARRAALARVARAPVARARVAPAAQAQARRPRSEARGGSTAARADVTSTWRSRARRA